MPRKDVFRKIIRSYPSTASLRNHNNIFFKKCLEPYRVDRLQNWKRSSFFNSRFIETWCKKIVKKVNISDKFRTSSNDKIKKKTINKVFKYIISYFRWDLCCRLNCSDPEALVIATGNFKQPVHSWAVAQRRVMYIVCNFCRHRGISSRRYLLFHGPRYGKIFMKDRYINLAIILWNR